ncbi:hypothetical protein HMPREF9123_2469 [Neisseria bacilliformis ATCC BAA-1200]|uniref:Uncharacterized protein n=1 Tax=Neisseria bacilliformis ATCC BAA-1200 TaxID=888742 RepID=F2BFG2_9NEIS|nr:hypothetical protein HMPREF9123_2469 [Neisseria bacilliformis ATCC BAA-1200]
MPSEPSEKPWVGFLNPTIRLGRGCFPLRGNVGYKYPTYGYYTRANGNRPSEKQNLFFRRPVVCRTQYPCAAAAHSEARAIPYRPNSVIPTQAEILAQQGGLEFDPTFADIRAMSGLQLNLPQRPSENP